MDLSFGIFIVNLKLIFQRHKKLSSIFESHENSANQNKKSYAHIITFISFLVIENPFLEVQKHVNTSQVINLLDVIGLTWKLTGQRK